MKKAMKKAMIFIVEDQQHIRTVLQSFLLNNGYESIAVGTLAEAEEIINQAPRIDASILDWSLGGGITTHSLIVKMVKAGFKNLIAFSNSQEDRQKQMELGCSYQWEKSDTEIVKFLDSILLS
jgi:DNA-binding response OmpR family regulator